jgi:hypothetical protein
MSQASAAPVAVYLPDGRAGLGVLSRTVLDVVEVRDSELVLPEVRVRDDSGDPLRLSEDLVFDPAAGGGPLATAEAERQARCFGLVNTAFHAQRALRYVNGLLGHPLAPLVIRTGVHDRPKRWGGGHYRVPSQLSTVECGPVEAHGEIHLGLGASYVAHDGGPGGRKTYFHAPSHNAAIIYHEVGHHVCRHTADFRLNRLRPADHQTNRKTAVDEGTCDYLTAALLGTPDIYGWHRATIPEWDQRRRRLSPQWTMAEFSGGHENDPHTDGTVWASALWSARQRLADHAVDPAGLDAMLVRGMAELGRDGVAPVTEEQLRHRRHFSRLLATMLAHAGPLTHAVTEAMAGHGIRLGRSNAVLRDEARQRLAVTAVRVAAPPVTALGSV